MIKVNANLLLNYTGLETNNNKTITFRLEVFQEHVFLYMASLLVLRYIAFIVKALLLMSIILHFINRTIDEQFSLTHKIKLTSIHM